MCNVEPIFVQGVYDNMGNCNLQSIYMVNVATTDPTYCIYITCMQTYMCIYVYMHSCSFSWEMWCCRHFLKIYVYLCMNSWGAYTYTKGTISHFHIFWNIAVDIHPIIATVEECTFGSCGEWDWACHYCVPGLTWDFWCRNFSENTYVYL